jgi:alpha-tubulin suppressor-like RCC1 family protein
MRAASTFVSLAAIAIAIAGVAAIAACSSEGVVGALAKDSADGASDGPDLGDAGPAPPLTPSATAIAAGGASTCVKTSAGDVRCWGENGSGSLGIGDVEPPTSAEPVTPTPLGKVRALRQDGKVSCWGDIFIGDFNGQPIDHLPAPSPFSIEASGEIAHVAVGRYFTCLLGTGGDVRCFGLNDKGQLGVGSTDKKYLPTTVNGFDGPVTSISASMGGLFVCATTHPGSVYCWGDNTDGQIAGEKGAVTEPRKMEKLEDRAVEVVSGGAHVCVRLASGSVKCWGSGDRGQLGNGGKSTSSVPVDVLYLTDVTMLAAGLHHTCAVRSEGSIFCWGEDGNGQAGASPDSSRPTLVRPASFGAEFASCGLAHSCAFGKGGRVECWGSDARSQLGPGPATF